MTSTTTYSTGNQTAAAPRRTRGPLREHRIFVAATTAVMVHIVDDNFLQPPDGTSAGDHLVSGTVPLALLVAAALFYPRLRAGARAVLALAVGLTGLVVGLAEAGYYTLAVGPSGDDYTGFVAGAGGVVLLALAATTLWRSRKQGRRMRRYLRRGGLGIAGLLVMAEVVAPFALGYVTTHVYRAGVPEPELGTAYEDVRFTTSDGLELEGWYVPSQNGAAVLIPGRDGPRPHARMLIEHGYGVLLFDRRGEGASEGAPNLFGWGGARDIHAAVEFLEGRPDVEPGRIGGLGLSVSGEMLLQAAAEDSRLAAVVSEGAGTRSISEELEEHDTPTLVRSFHTLLAKQASLMIFSNERPPPSLVDLTPRIAPRPVLLIWAPDGGNLETMNPVYQQLIGPSAEIWSIPDATHVGGLEAHPEEYERRVIEFLDRSLLGDSPAGQ